jgi:hypothetical protein
MDCGLERIRKVEEECTLFERLVHGLSSSQPSETVHAP